MTTQAVDEEELPVHTWRVARLTQLGIPRAVAEAEAGRLDWHQVTRLVQHGCPRGWPYASSCDERTREVARTGRTSLATWGRLSLFGGVSSHTGREPPGKAEWVRAKAERARKKAAEAQAMRAEAEAKAAEEQAAALARAQHEDEAQRQADLRTVAEKEAEAAPDWPPGP